MIRRLAIPALISAGCTAATVTPEGDLAGPAAVVSAQRFAGGTATPVVYLANADNDELRVYLPDDKRFVRGPNGISPLSIPVGFRPEHLASGVVGTDADARGFVVAVGTGEGVTVVDTQTNRRTVMAGCDGAAPVPPKPNCLPGEAIDVGVSGATVFVLIDDDGAGSQAVVTMVATNVDGRPTLESAAVVPVSGAFSGLSAASPGIVYLADRAAARVVEFDVAAKSLRVITAAGPVRDVVVVPAYGTRPAAEYLLALLTDGRLQTLSPSAGGPAPDPIDASKAIAPLDFGTPVRDVTFVPCPGGVATCRPRIATGETTSIEAALLGFAALGDGSAAAIVPDDSKPQVFRAVDTQTGAVGLVRSDLPACPGTGPTGCYDATSFTEGITRTEQITATFRGALPNLSNRAGALSPRSPPTLDDPAGGLDAARPDDVVTVTNVGAACPGFERPVEFTVAAAFPTKVEFAAAPGAPTPCVGQRVAYTVRAGPADPWVISGALTGPIGRAPSGGNVVVTGSRFVYPAGAAQPADAVALRFTLPATEPAAGATLAISTTSGWNPYRLPSGTTAFATGVAATPNRLYLTLLGARATNSTSTVLLNTFVDVTLTAANTAAGILFYQ